MGKIYKRKRRSCALCKPHKTGGADKLKPHQRQELTLAEAEMREAKLSGRPDKYDDMYDDQFQSEYAELHDMIDHIYDTY